MDRKKFAARYHGQKFNCAQSVLAALSDFTGLDEETALAIAGGFGNGVNCGDMCGAATGAVMAIGMADRFTKPGDIDKKREVSKLTRIFLNEFKERFYYIDCRDLKDTEKGKVPCDDLITGAVEIAEKLLADFKNNSQGR